MNIHRKDYEQFARIVKETATISPEAAGFLQREFVSLFSESDKFRTDVFNTACGIDTKFTTLEKFNKAYEERINQRAKIDVQPLHARIRYLVSELSKSYPVTGLLMGRGGYNLTGKNFNIINVDDSRGTMVMRYLLSYFEDSSDWSWKPIGTTAYHSKIAKELISLLDYLTDTDTDLPLLDITEDEL